MNIISLSEHIAQLFISLRTTNRRNHFESTQRRKIIPYRDYDKFETKKPDALIIKKPNVIAIIEYKVPKELRTEKQIAAALSQELGTAQTLKAKIYIVTDGRKSFWIKATPHNSAKIEGLGSINELIPQ